MRHKRLPAVAATAVAAFAIVADGALAGEITGNGKKENQNQGRSWCSFSGQNDDPTASQTPPIGPNGPGGTSQSYGQENKLGLVDPRNDKFMHPGTFCNPNKSPLPDFPNRR